MKETNDPRYIRTKKLIMDAFSKLATQKKFSQITIKDITKEATVNRATFYYHFVDKYDLLDTILNEQIMKELIEKISHYKSLNEKTIEAIFIAVVEFLSVMSNQCRRSFEAFTPKVEEILKQKLKAVFIVCMEHDGHTNNEQEIDIAATFLSWGLFGLAMNYLNNPSNNLQSYTKQMKPLLLAGNSACDSMKQLFTVLYTDN